MKVKNAAWIPPHRYTHMQLQFYPIKMHKLLGLADTYTFILLSFSPLFPVRIPVNVNKTASGWTTTVSYHDPCLVQSNSRIIPFSSLIESPHLRQCLAVNPALQSEGSPTDVLSPSATPANCNLCSSSFSSWTLEIKVSGNSGNWCCDSQWEIFLPINQQKCAVVIYSWSTYIQVVLTECFPVLLVYWISILILLVPLFLKYEVFKNTQLPHKYTWNLSSYEHEDKKVWRDKSQSSCCAYWHYSLLFSSSTLTIKVFFPIILKETNHFPKSVFKFVWLRKFYFP